MATAAISVRFHPAATAARHVSTSRRARLAVFRAQSAPAAAALTQDDLKRLAAVLAVDQMESGMVLGLGTGSTAAFAVAEIGALLAAGKLSGIVGVPTSKRTFEQAQSLGIPLSTLDDHPRIDLAINSADEVRLLYPCLFLPSVKAKSYADFEAKNYLHLNRFLVVASDTWRSRTVVV
jgi:ribose 5-phosphate isomerase A